MNGNLRKTAFGLLMAVALIAGPFTAEAGNNDPVKIGEIWYMLNDSQKTASVTSTFERDESGCLVNYAGDVVIPPYVDYAGRSYRVVSIASGTFDNTLVKSLSLPETVVRIGDNASCLMPRLRSVSVDKANPSFTSFDGVLYTHDMKIMLLFPRCRVWNEDYSELLFEEYTIPEGVETINTTFAHTDIKRLILPNTLKKIGDHGFQSSDITGIELPESIEYLGEYCFADIQNEFELRIPDNLTNIGDYCFEGSNFTSVILPSNITSIGEGWFRNCSRLKKMKLHEGIAKIGILAFAGSTVNLELPESLTELESYAFQDLVTHEMRIPDKVYELPDVLFLGSSIRRLTLGKGTRIIGGIFTDCKFITDVYCPCDKAPGVYPGWPLGLDIDNERRGKVNVHVFSGRSNEYHNAGWDEVGPIIEDLTDGIDEIHDNTSILDDELCDVYSLSGVKVTSQLRFVDLQACLSKGFYIVRTATGRATRIAVE